MEDSDSEPELSSPRKLADDILRFLQKSTFDSRPSKYLPERRIKELVTEENVFNELALDEVGEIELKGITKKGFVDFILHEAPRTFLILIAVQRSEKPHESRAKLLSWRRKGFTDKKLPIEEPGKESKLHHFYQEQWAFLAPVFSPDRYEYNLDPDCILPIERSPGPTKKGAFGSVFKVKIHPDHNRNSGIKEVAIKEIAVNVGDFKAATDREWDREAGALKKIKSLEHPHIIECLAAIRRGDSRYFMFPWANGDSLREFWQRNPKQTPNRSVVEQTIIQLRGIADALKRLHNFNTRSKAPNAARHGTETQDHTLPRLEFPEMDLAVDVQFDESIRHGDLKPENILRFTNGGSKSAIGTLKIADMGLAKQHINQTQDRTHITSTKFGTVRYEAPETSLGVPRSRLYDIWSMGCITFEFIIWMMYGNEALERFYEEMKGGAQHTCQFFEFINNGDSAKVHNVVIRWMDHIQNTVRTSSHEKGSAILDLLDVVRTKLLVVQIPLTRANTLENVTLSPPAGPGQATSGRATAIEFCGALDSIIGKIGHPGYLELARTLYPPTTNSGPRGPDLLLPIAPKRIDTRGDYTLPPLQDWEFPVDNSFAHRVLARTGIEHFVPREAEKTTLCGRCKGLDFWASGFSFDDKVSALEVRAKHCAFCKILLAVCLKHEAYKKPKVRFERLDSSLMMAEGDRLPVLSIVRSPKCQTHCPRSIQIGFPVLPQPGSSEFFAIIKLWLDDCDKNTIYHKGCHGISTARLPTRLVDVQGANAPFVRLVETREDKIQCNRYIALSHPWGDPEKHPPCSTRRSNLANFKKAILFGNLPRTFQDAVKTTRALGVRYLWIDSLCIVQGKDGDFNEEAKRMEDVFSGAYCVLAASRATGQSDGFLGARIKRKYTKFQRGAEEPFYICEPINDFQQHVLDGPLNQRGWVLQERALARRTIYFTEWQTYFECGNGIRCETLGMMQNNMAEFLGDPRFPDKAISKNRAFKIKYFQELYRQYTRLEFSRIEDRPFAIAGLEKRLQKAFGTEGGYGIFDDGPDGGLFHRSLLWQRGSDETSLAPIDFPLERNIKVPSWSWMAYKGGIDYGDPDFQTADWEASEVRAPWTTGSNHLNSYRENPDTVLKATVRDFNVAGWKENEVRLLYDTERTSSDGKQRPQCVIVARSKTGTVAQEGKRHAATKHYVLIVATTGTTARGEKIYNRVAAGYMLGKFITLEGPGAEAEIR